MDERKTCLRPKVISAVEAFWGGLPIYGPVRSISTRCAGPEGALSGNTGVERFLDHEREEFDEHGRLVERIRYDDEGQPYRRERVVYPDADPSASRAIRFLVKPLDGGSPFEWRYLPDSARILASLFEANDSESARWSYSLDADGRVVECTQKDGRGQYLGRDTARYDHRCRLVELITTEPNAVKVCHRFEYGDLFLFRRIVWDGGQAGSYLRDEQFEEVDRHGNWLRMSESTFRDGVEVGTTYRYMRKVEYYG